MVQLHPGGGKVIQVRGQHVGTRAVTDVGEPEVILRGNGVRGQAAQAAAAAAAAAASDLHPSEGWHCWARGSQQQAGSIV